MSPLAPESISGRRLGGGRGALVGAWVDRRRRGAVLMGLFALVGVLLVRLGSQPAAIVFGEAAALLALGLLGTLLDAVGITRGLIVGLMGRLIVSAALAVPFASRLLVGGGSATAFEMVMLTMLGLAAVLLALCGTAPRQAALSVISSGFLMLFTASISDTVTTVYVAVVWVLLCLWWMLANHWQRLEVHMAQSVRRHHGVRAAMTALGLVVCALAALASWGRGPASRLIRDGVMPTSGGGRWSDPAARSGVGSGDAVVAARQHAASFGAVESEIFLQSHQPSLFDVFDEVIGRPRRTVRNEKAMALANRDVRRNRRRSAQSQQGDAGFSIRRHKAPRPSQLEDRETPALLQWVGPTGVRLAVQRFNHFDGEQWTFQPGSDAAVDVSGSGYRPSRLQRIELDGKPWFFRPRRRDPSLGPARGDAVKIINLDSPRIPAPAGTLGVHIADIDREDFFDLEEDGSFFMPGRPRIPALTVVRLVTASVDADWLSGLPELPRPPSSSSALAAESTSGVRLAEQLGRQWAGAEQSPWQQVEAVVARLRQDFEFDRAAASAQDDALLAFLQTGRGGDQLFATAAAVMLRGLGYQTRLVTGFYVPQAAGWPTGQVDVLPEHAHCWVEVMVDADFWVAIEPTPGYGDPQRHRAAFRRWLSTLWAGLPLLLTIFVAALVTWVSRRWWGEWLCRLLWLVSLPLPERRRIALLVRLLDWRGRLAGLRRPSGMTPRSWAEQVSAAADRNLRDTARRFFDGADVAFYGRGVAPAGWLADANELVRGLSVPVLIRFKRIG